MMFKSVLRVLALAVVLFAPIAFADAETRLRQIEPAVRAIAVRSAGTPGDVEDLVQEGLMAALELMLESPDPVPPSFLVSRARYRMINWIRKDGAVRSHDMHQRTQALERLDLSDPSLTDEEIAERLSLSPTELANARLVMNRRSTEQLSEEIVSAPVGETDTIETREHFEIFEKEVEKLPLEQRLHLRLRYGLGGEGFAPVSELGMVNFTGKSQRRVRDIYRLLHESVRDGDFGRLVEVGRIAPGVPKIHRAYRRLSLALMLEGDAPPLLLPPLLFSEDESVRERAQEEMRLALNEIDPAHQIWLRLFFGLDGFAPIAIHDLAVLFGDIARPGIIAAEALIAIKSKLLERFPGSIGLIAEPHGVGERYRQNVHHRLNEVAPNFGMGGFLTTRDSQFPIFMNNLLQSMPAGKAVWERAYISDRIATGALKPFDGPCIHYQSKTTFPAIARGTRMYAAVFAAHADRPRAISFRTPEARRLAEQAAPYYGNWNGDLRITAAPIFRHGKVGAVAMLREAAIRLIGEALSNGFGPQRLFIELAKKLPDSIARQRDALVAEFESSAWKWQSTDGENLYGKIRAARRVYRALFRLAVLVQRSLLPSLDPALIYESRGAYRLYYALVPEAERPWGPRLSRGDFDLFIGESRGSYLTWAGELGRLGFTFGRKQYGVRNVLIEIVHELPDAVGVEARQKLEDDLRSESWGWEKGDATFRQVGPERFQNAVHAAVRRIAELVHPLSPTFDAQRIYLASESRKFFLALASLNPKYQLRREAELTSASMRLFLDKNEGTLVHLLEEFKSFGITRLRAPFGLQLAFIELAGLLPDAVGEKVKQDLIDRLRSDELGWVVNDWQHLNATVPILSSAHRCFRALYAIAEVLYLYRRSFSLKHLAGYGGSRLFFHRFRTLIGISRPMLTHEITLEDDKRAIFFGPAGTIELLPELFASIGIGDLSTIHGLPQAFEALLGKLEKRIPENRRKTLLKEITGEDWGWRDYDWRNRHRSRPVARRIYGGLYLIAREILPAKSPILNALPDEDSLRALFGAFSKDCATRIGRRRTAS